jgi:primosomal protein N' (replication factor Y) (superfamily II helicase)
MADRTAILAEEQRTWHLATAPADWPEAGTSAPSPAWVDVLVDVPGTPSLFTYALPPDLAVQPGDILSVPFGPQQVGAIAIRLRSTPPTDLDPRQVRAIESIISAGFFPPSYWTLLNRVADYYCTPLMQVIRVALPPGLLAKSQRRLRLLDKPSATVPLTVPAQGLLTLLQASKTGDYSWQYANQKVPQARRGLQELLKAGLVESYLEPPTPARVKQRQAVMLVSAAGQTELTPRQQEIATVLKRHGGELWLTELLQLCQTSSATLKALEKKGCVTIQPRQVLRTETGGAIAPDTVKPLMPDQATALAAILPLTDYRPVLLHGVTGSGKTEVYLQAIAPRLALGQSALVLVPEIGLTPQLTDRFRARFGDRVCVYHSALSDGERYDTWRQMLSGTAQVIIGTRSAIFAPLPHLGILILDEEHDSSFKQDQPAPCYHARTVAHWRAELENCPLILGSATPSLESWLALQSPISSLIPNPQSSIPNPLYLSLPTRIHDRPMPPIAIVDMRQELQDRNFSIFSRSLCQALEDLQTKQHQGILFIHRRGHSTFVSCRSCGYVVMCPHCDVSLSYHQIHAEAPTSLRCHYCGHTQSLPSTCPSCQSVYFKHFGSGTQRVTQELERLFPQLRVMRFDSDTTRTKGAHRALLAKFAQGDADLLVGTQMLTKGIDLPQVTLVGIVAADGLLHFADYRASERTFQTLTQVAGRCGRGSDRGQVILQTYSPEHPVIQAVQQNAYASFVAAELEQRASLNYPPYGRLILLRLSSPSAIAVQAAAERIAHTLTPTLPSGVELLGPAPASILRVARRYRWQILLKTPATVDFALPDLADLRALCPQSVSLTLDIDPLNLM